MFDIFVDSAANIPAEKVREYGIKVISFKNFVNGEYITCFDPNASEEEERVNGKKYYDALRNGAECKTSLVSIQEFADAFEQSLKEEKDVLYISLSHGISGTFNSARLAIESLVDEYPNQKMFALDSYNASLGQGLLAIYASILRAKDMPVEKVFHILDSAKLGMNGIFTVDDLKYLAATGRVSNAKAFLGNTLNVKPLLKGSHEGVIVQFKLARGRKKSLKTLINLVLENIIEPEKQILGIAHADAYEESLYIMNEIQKEIKVKDFINTTYDFCTGTHVGPETIALFFIGGNRELEGNKEASYAKELLEELGN
ncbi:MAG: DegV family protein [Bacillota bacterium]|nr:DegV family protein [Bacillota bacterium]